MKQVDENCTQAVACSSHQLVQSKSTLKALCNKMLLGFTHNTHIRALRCLTYGVSISWTLPMLIYSRQKGNPSPKAKLQPSPARQQAVSSPLGKGTAEMHRQKQIPNQSNKKLSWRAFCFSYRVQLKANYTTIMPLNIRPELIPNLRAEKNSICSFHVQIPAT